MKRKQKRPTKELRHIKFWRVHFDNANTSLTTTGGFKAVGAAKKITKDNIRRHLDWNPNAKEPHSPYVSAFVNQDAAERRAAHHAAQGQNPSIHEFQTTLKISYSKAYNQDYEVFLPVWRAGRMIGRTWRPSHAKGGKEVLFLETAAVRCFLDVPKQESDFAEWLIMSEVLPGMKVTTWKWTGDDDQTSAVLNSETGTFNSLLAENGDSDKVDGRSIQVVYRPKVAGNRQEEREVLEVTGPIVVLGTSDADESSDDGDYEEGGGFRLVR